MREVPLTLSEYNFVVKALSENLVIIAKSVFIFFVANHFMFVYFAAAW